VLALVQLAAETDSTLYHAKHAYPDYRGRNERTINADT